MSESPALSVRTQGTFSASTKAERFAQIVGKKIDARPGHQEDPDTTVAGKVKRTNKRGSKASETSANAIAMAVLRTDNDLLEDELRRVTALLQVLEPANARLHHQLKEERSEHQRERKVFQATIKELQAENISLKKEAFEAQLQKSRESAGAKIDELSALLLQTERMEAFLAKQAAEQAAGPGGAESAGVATAPPPMMAGSTTPSGFLVSDSWVHALTAREQKLLEPKVMESVGKLLRLKGTVTYPKERGGAAKGPVVWKEEALIKPGLLTAEELNLIPEWVYLRFDKGLYKALQNAKQAAKKAINRNS